MKIEWNIYEEMSFENFVFNKIVDILIDNQPNDLKNRYYKADFNHFLSFNIENEAEKYAKNINNLINNNEKEKLLFEKEQKDYQNVLLEKMKSIEGFCINNITLMPSNKSIYIDLKNENKSKIALSDGRIKLGERFYFEIEDRNGKLSLKENEKLFFTNKDPEMNRETDSKRSYLRDYSFKPEKRSVYKVTTQPIEQESELDPFVQLLKKEFIIQAQMTVPENLINMKNIFNNLNNLQKIISPLFDSDIKLQDTIITESLLGKNIFKDLSKDFENIIDMMLLSKDIKIDVDTVKNSKKMKNS